MIKVQTENIYDAMLASKEEFNMSKCEQKHSIWSKYCDKSNKKIVNKMKDHISIGAISKFCV